jgi:hypothetical protein
VIVEKEKNPRTYQSNKYYWGVVISVLSEELGYDEEDMHNLMREMFLKRRIIIKGKEYISVASTASLDTVAFGEYVDKIKRWSASELGIYIPEPESVKA